MPIRRRSANRIANAISSVTPNARPIGSASANVNANSRPRRMPRRMPRLRQLLQPPPRSSSRMRIPKWLPMAARRRTMPHAVKAVDGAGAVAAAVVAAIARASRSSALNRPKANFRAPARPPTRSAPFTISRPMAVAPDEPGEHAPQESPREAAHEPAERPERVEHAEPPREQRSEGTQAPLDLPPPPPAKPFVVWSSSPTGTPETRRDE